MHVFLRHGKDALGLNAAVHANQLPLVGADPLLHFFPLSGKALGNINYLVSFLQRLFTPTGADALLLQWTTSTVLAAVNRGFYLIAALRFVFLGEVKGNRLSVCACITGENNLSWIPNATLPCPISWTINASLITLHPK